MSPEIAITHLLTVTQFQQFLILCLCTNEHELSEPRIEYLLGGSSKNCSHVYFLLIVAMVLLLWCQIVLLWHHVIMVSSEHLFQTIVHVLPRKLAAGSIHDYLVCYCPLVGILFEVLRIMCFCGDMFWHDSNIIINNRDMPVTVRICGYCSD